MKSWMTLALTLLAGTLTIVGSATGQTKPKATPLVLGNTEFALDLYGKLAREQGNLLFSPYSISNALAMTYDGARNNTAAEMKKALHFFADPRALNPAFGALIHQLQEKTDKTKFKLVVANRLFGQKDYGFLPDFLKVQRDFYDAPLEEVDFQAATDAARLTINNWVSQQTADKIKDLIQPGVLNKNSRLVLANAIYFKAAWMSPFNIKNTATEKFFVTADKTVQTPIMHTSVRTNFLKTEGFSALELPYEDRKQSIVLFLPEKVDGLAELEKKFTADNLSAWLSKMSDHQVKVALPKFKVTGQFNLNQVLQSLGVRDAFSDKADFSGMASHDKLSISAVVHKAFIDLNEAGTEAAASTAVLIGRTSLPQAGTFQADHPFAYVIKDNSTGAILFMGRVANPT